MADCRFRGKTWKIVWHGITRNGHERVRLESDGDEAWASVHEIEVIDWVSVHDIEVIEDWVRQMQRQCLDGREPPLC